MKTLDSKRLFALAELTDIVTTTKKISLELKGETYIVRDMANRQVIANGDIYHALECARRYR